MGLLVPGCLPSLLTPSLLPFDQLRQGPTERKSHPPVTVGRTQTQTSAELGSLPPTPCLILLTDDPEKSEDLLSKCVI